jgi:hypothetical protein
MATQTTEQELVEIVRAAVAPVQFKWGWAALESAEKPPSLGLVVMVRTVADAAAWLDMCQRPTETLKANVTVSIHVWALEYEPVRALQAKVRAAAHGAPGWALLSETDQYDGAFKAWVITSDWQAIGLELV